MNWGEPWTVQLGVARLGAKNEYHLHDAYGRLLNGKGERLKALNERIAVCVNFCAGISDLALTLSTDETALIKSVLANPAEMSCRMALVDELNAIIEATDKNKTYVPREQMVKLLERIYLAINTPLTETWIVIQRQILQTIGVKCQKTLTHEGSTYSCDYGWFRFPTDKEVKRCSLCKGTGLVIPNVAAVHALSGEIQA